MRWKLVPVEPTEEMAFAWVRAANGSYDEYTAMLAAAPPASQDEELVEKVAALLRDTQLSYWSWELRARAILKMLGKETDHG